MSFTDEQICRLRLYRTPKIGPRTFHRLCATHGSAQGAVTAILEGQYPALKLIPTADIQKELKALAKIGGCLLCWDDPLFLNAWPTDAPPILSYVGDVSLLKRPMLAIVGARNASFHGIHFATRVAKTISEKGVGVISGLARGIDKAAHEGSLKVGPIAVVGTGLGHIYPEDHKDLYATILKKGLVISGFVFHEGPQASHFPRRNYMMAALAKAVLVVEAAQQSGSLLTAQYAADLGRDVLVVPGSPMDPRARGGNRLIQEGATLVQNADDVLDVFGDMPAYRKTPSPSFVENESPLDGLEGKVLNLLTTTPTMVDDVAGQLNIPVARVMTLLTKLEIDEKVKTHQGQRVSLALKKGT